MDRQSFLARKKASVNQTVELTDGQAVKVRKLTQAEVEHSRKNYATDGQALAGYRYIVSKCTLNDDGTQMFEDKDMSDLLDMPYDDIETIATAVMRFSGVLKDPKKG